MKNERIYSLLDIQKKEKKLLNGIIDYYNNTNEIIIYDEVLDILDNTDYNEIIPKYNSDVKKSIKNFVDFIIVLHDKIYKNLNLKQPIEDIFLKNIKESNNELFPIKIGNFKIDYNTVNNVPKITISTKKISIKNKEIDYKELFSFYNDLDTVELEQKLLIFVNNYNLGIPKTSISASPFKYTFGTLEQTASEYINGLKKLPERITTKYKFIDFFKELDIILSKQDNSKTKDINKLILGKTRATIKDTLDNSIILRKNGKIIESNLQIVKINQNEEKTAIKQKQNRNNLINDLITNFSKNNNILEMEIDKDTSLSETIKLLNILEIKNINTQTPYQLKIRKLGNYNATGLEIQTDLPIVAIDPRVPFSLIHELSHLLYENIYIKNEELSVYSNDLINKLKMKMTDIPAKKKEYYYKPTEIFARIGEIAYILNLINYTNDVKGKEFSNDIYFTEEKIKELNEKSKELNDGLIKEFNFYFDKINKGIYFNFDKMTINELSTAMLYFQDYYTFQNKIPKQIKDINFENVFENKNKSTLMLKINRGKINPNIRPVFEEFNNKIKNINKMIFEYKYKTYNKNEKDFEKELNENFNNLKNSLLYKIISNDKDINLYTNFSEFKEKFETFIKEIIIQKEIENLSWEIELKHFKEEKRKIENLVNDASWNNSTELPKEKLEELNIIKNKIYEIIKTNKNEKEYKYLNKLHDVLYNTMQSLKKTNKELKDIKNESGYSKNIEKFNDYIKNINNTYFYTYSNNNKNMYITEEILNEKNTKQIFTYNNLIDKNYFKYFAYFNGPYISNRKEYSIFNRFMVTNFLGPLPKYRLDYKQSKNKLNKEDFNYLLKTKTKIEKRFEKELKEYSKTLIPLILNKNPNLSKKIVENFLNDNVKETLITFDKKYTKFMNFIKPKTIEKENELNI